MKGVDVRPMDILMVGGVVVGLYLLWQGIKAAKAAAGAVGDAVATGAKAADTAVAGVVSGIGSAVGLPSSWETLDNPAQVRWIIDHVSTFAASKWGTAAAFGQALWMAPGSGDNSPPSRDVLTKLGVAAAIPMTQTSQDVYEFITGGNTTQGGPSFNDVAAGKNIYNPMAWGG